MDGKKLMLYILLGTLAVGLLIFFGFQWYFSVNPTQ